MTTSTRPRGLAVLVMLGGVAVIAVAASADHLGMGNRPGLGTSQVLLALFGLLIIAGGGLLTSRKGSPFLTWLDARAAPAEQPGLIILLAAMLAVVAGAGELLMLLLQRPPHHFMDQRYVTPHAGWKTPLSYLMLFALPGSFLALTAATGVPIFRSLRTATFVLAFLVLFSWLQAYWVELSSLSILLLATGMATALARYADGNRERVERQIRRAALPLVIAVFLIGATVPAVLWLHERVQRANLPEPVGTTNVVLIILDTMRAPSMSLYGYARPTTPVLDSLAAESTVFDRALSPAPWTLSSHAGMFTGRYPLELSASWDMPLDDTYPTIAEVLADNGLLTAGFVANRTYTGFHTGLTRGFMHYDVEINSVRGVVWASRLARWLADRTPVQRLLGLPFNGMYMARKHGPEVTTEFLRWVDAAEGRPFFAFLNYMDVHDPYPPEDAVSQQFLDSEPPLPSGVLEHVESTSRTSARLIGRYDEQIRSLDRELGRLFASLDERSLRQNTLVIVASDHGEEFGEKGIRAHGQSLNLPALHVPLMLRLPGRIAEGLRVGVPVSLADLPATVLDVLGVPEPSVFSGSSLAQYWLIDSAATVVADSTGGDLIAVRSETQGKAWLRPDRPVSRGDMRSLMSSHYYYILNGDGVEELYDPVGDPYGQTDLAGARLPETESVLKQFRVFAGDSLPVGHHADTTRSTGAGFASSARGPHDPSGTSP